jgi:hypothetical protein
MKKYYRTLFALIAAVLFLGLGAGQCLAGNAKQGDQKLHRDGSTFVKESRVLQADRQAAADRAKAKGFQPVKVGGPEKASNTAPTKKEAKK